MSFPGLACKISDKKCRTHKETVDMRKFYLQPLFSTSVDDNYVIILGERQFTIYDDYYVEQDIDITETDPEDSLRILDRMKTSGRSTRVTNGSLFIEGYLWFVQYDNHKEITLEDFRLFMDGITLSRLNSETLESGDGDFKGDFNFNDAVNYIGVSFSDIPKIGF